MSFLRRAAVAGALAGTALVATTGSAFAAESHGPRSTDDGAQSGLVNVGDVQTVTPINACNNDVPVNALGVQVPVEDVSGVLDVGGLLGDHQDGSGSAAQPESQSCRTGTDAAA
ncbi:hypothetical protein [Actinomycetospora chlora]|jgi:hypothetical protein|uniref:hypothetical protein n=1 Tax=Actinomycetospora chlora TaxID=663608 RepID=UPI0031E8DD7C